MRPPAMAQAVFGDRNTLARTPGELLVTCERQRLPQGATRIERVQGLGAIVNDDRSACSLLFQRSGLSRLWLAERPAELQAGHWSVVVGTGSRLEVERGGEAVSLTFGAEHLPRGLSGQVQTAREDGMRVQGASRMCLELARSCLGQAEPPSGSVADALGEAMIELGKLAMIEQFCTRRGETVRETVRARIHSYIRRNLADPELTIERIAERMGCTKRYLHKVFSDQEETLNQYIWSQRLELCRARLSQPELAGRSITAIAFDCGFSNAAHFSRSFRARFGECPRVYRRSALAG